MRKNNIIRNITISGIVGTGLAMSGVICLCVGVGIAKVTSSVLDKALGGLDERGGKGG